MAKEITGIDDLETLEDAEILLAKVEKFPATVNTEKLKVQFIGLIRQFITNQLTKAHVAEQKGESVSV